MHIPKSVLLACVLVVGLVVGFWAGASPSSPVNPNPPRPVANALARVVRLGARLGLWMALAAEEPPAAPEQRQQLVHAPRFDAEGHPVIDHREGW